jgi:hypothetical protein
LNLCFFHMVRRCQVVKKAEIQDLTPREEP